MLPADFMLVARGRGKDARHLLLCPINGGVERRAARTSDRDAPSLRPPERVVSHHAFPLFREYDA